MTGKICRLLIGLLILSGLLLKYSEINASAHIEVSSPSCILIEPETGEILFEQGADIKRTPASVTKIMTLLLVLEAIEQGNAALEDQVITSEYASSMGGSQVYLAQGEIQTLETLIKCIVVASGNDASVAAAEHISGSEAAFVEKMNEKAFELGMVNTHFVDCCGLTDSTEHYTTARDVGLMTRELICSYPEIFRYSGIWMEDIVHETNGGSHIFTLSNTNKLLKQYEYATGLKTGYTSNAGFCLSATARKGDLSMIAVILGAADSKTRFQEARALLNYGFSLCRLYRDEEMPPLKPLPIKGAIKDTVALKYEEEFRYLDTEGIDFSGITREIQLPEQVNAPVALGQRLGEIIYSLNGKRLGTIGIAAAEEVLRATFGEIFKKIWFLYLL